MFGTKCALVATVAATTMMLCSTPANAAPEDEFITLNSAVTAAPDGLQATGTYSCDGGIGYLDVSAQMNTNGSGTVLHSATSGFRSKVSVCGGPPSIHSTTMRLALAFAAG